MREYIGKKFDALHRARELALQFLFSLEINQDQDFNSAIELFINNDELTHNDKPEVKAHCKKLAYEVSRRKNEIDSLLLRIITGWRPERIDIVDRTILRLMIFEGFIIKSLPVKSAMSEAQRLAESSGTKDSSRFITGIMFKASKFLEAEALRELEATFK